MAGSLLLVLSACSEEGDAAGPSGDPDSAITGDETVSFRRDVRPLLVARCGSCHVKGSVLGYDVANPFDPKDGLINRPNSWAQAHDSPFDVIVKPGAPDESFLIYKIETPPDAFDTKNSGSPMPLDVPAVTASELSDIKQWILDGAKDDAFFRERVAPVLGTELSLGSKGGKCTLCHFAGSSTRLDVLAVFDDEVGLVNAPSVYSDKLRVAPGKPEESFLVEKIEAAQPSAGGKMPLHLPRLSAAEVDRVRTWVAEGAKNN